MSERVFSWGEGLDSNLGDSVLRRGLVRRLEQHGPQHVYIGACSSGYLAGLNPSPDSVLYRSQIRWYLAILRSSLVRRTHVHMSPGEAIADRRSVPMRLAFASLALAVRLRGGGVHQTGVGIRSPLGKWVWPLKLTARLTSTLTWRDDWSRQVLGQGEVAPDWAIGEGPVALAQDGPERDLLTISLRGDRAWPSDREIEAIARLAETADLRPAVVSQVAADDRLAKALSDRLGAELILWGDGDHSVAETRVRAIYRRTRLILSDRVHALIIAATEGAVPRAFGIASTEKAGRTLAAAGFEESVLSLQDIEAGMASPSVAKALSDKDEVAATIAWARKRLDHLAATLPGAGFVRRARLRVLHSMAAPDGRVTRYADHMAHVADEETDIEFFSWRRALFSHYDVFHVHWPEYLVRGRTFARRWMKYAAFSALMLRLSLGRIAVVRTLHNLNSHEQGRWVERKLLKALDARTTRYISLNATTGGGLPAPVDHIPHGHYVERFAPHPRGEAVPGKIIFFGLIRPYKNVPGLLNVFRAVDRDDLTLQITGKPNTASLEAQIFDLASLDRRVSLRLDFVDDADLVSDVTSSQIVVLPYTEMHNSGVLLVALSLGKVVLAPRSAVNEELQAEVGEDWLVLFEGPLTASQLVACIRKSSSVPGDMPDLSRRDWSVVSAHHRATYRRAARDAHMRLRSEMGTAGGLGG